MAKKESTIKNSLVFEGFMDYAPSPESTSHIEIKPQYDLFIDGKWQKPKSGKYFDSINPANQNRR